MGAQVHGYALNPPTTPNLFDTAQLATDLTDDTRADISDYNAVLAAMAKAKPGIVLHLAAQSLVRYSYHAPLETYITNVLGTAHVLEAARHTPGIEAVVVVTTDKCYENTEQPRPYRESDRLGGHDPYSSSKACAEIVAACWRQSYAPSPRIATARAGNVIGAGDWGVDRLLPDCFTAFAQGRPVQLRRPDAVRPWQHVLEPLSGYLLLAETLCNNDGERFAQAWNFGPDAESEMSVGEVARLAASAWGSNAQIEIKADPTAPHEAGQLRLDSSLARGLLDWQPRWTLPQAVAATAAGYRTWADGGNLRSVVLQQIDHYLASRA
jgi:CDP-glucose 4,6-dehydratase